MLKLNHRNVFKVFCRHKHAKTHWVRSRDMIRSLVITIYFSFKSQKDKRIFPRTRAMDSFDDFYGNVFGLRWKSMRLALLCEHKYIALVNNFGDVEQTAELLEGDGAINVRSIYEVEKKNLSEISAGKFGSDNILNVENRIDQFIGNKRNSEIEEIYSNKDRPGGSDSSAMEFPKNTIDYKKPLEKVIEEDSNIDYGRIVDPNYGTSALHEFIPATKIKGMEDFVYESDYYRYYSNTNDFPLKIEMEMNFRIPENLQLYTFEKGNVSVFRHPRRCTTGVLSHFLMGGASILPPLVLDVKPGDHVFDACAAPGGKSMLMLQTHLPKVLVSNDVSQSRCNRIKGVMFNYIYDFDQNWNNHRCVIRQEDARSTSDYGAYDKVLVDVPCTTDRLAVTDDDDNIFKPTRVKERLRIPEVQAGILTNCIRLLKPGGSLVYSTCTLSPVQNDGVVHMALASVFKEHGITVTINDLSFAMKPFSSIMRFEDPKGLKYGQMVIPFLPANFGPMYFCKMTRN